MWKGGCWESRLVLSSGGSHFSHMFGKTKICYQLSFSGKIHFHWYFSPHFDTQHFLRSDYGPWLEEWILGILTLFPFILPKVSHISFINWFCILSVSLIQPSLSSRPGVEHKTEALWPARLLPKQDGRTADAGWRCINLVHFNIDSIARDVSLNMSCLIREKFDHVMFNQGKAESRRQEDSMWARWVGDNYLDFEFVILKKLKSLIVGGFPNENDNIVGDKVFLQILCSARWHRLRGLGEELLRWDLGFVRCPKSDLKVTDF